MDGTQFSNSLDPLVLQVHESLMNAFLQMHLTLARKEMDREQRRVWAGGKELQEEEDPSSWHCIVPSTLQAPSKC